MTDDQKAAAVVTGLREVKAWAFPKSTLPHVRRDDSDRLLWIVDNGTGAWWKRHDNGDMERTNVFEGQAGHPLLEGMLPVDVPWWYTA